MDRLCKHVHISEVFTQNDMNELKSRTMLETGFYPIYLL